MTREECCAVVSEKEMPMTVYDMVAAMQEKFASRPAFRWVDDATTTVKEKTYGEFVADIRKMTGYLQETVADLKGQRIAILSRTNYEYGVVAFGTMMAGAVIVTLNQKKTWPELEYELGLSEPALIFTDGIDYGYAEELKAAYGDKLRPMNAYEGSAPAAFENRIDPDGLRMLLFTSGTTGRSKGVMLSERNMCTSLCTYGARAENWITSRLPEGQKLPLSHMTLLPLFHMACFVCVMSYPPAGWALNLCSDIRDFYRDLGLMHSDAIAVAPMLMEAIYKDVKRGRRARLNGVWNPCGSSAMFDGAMLAELAQQGMMITQVYGMTETCGDGIINYEQDEKHIRAVGKPDDHAEYKLDETGEICIRGGCVMLGYYKDPEATAEVLDADGWFHTGDLARVDEDGFYYITGRKKNIIILDNGENVSPEELENLLSKCEAVKECIVREKGKKICAVIYCGEADQQTVRDFITETNRTLPLYKRMSAVEFSTEPLPRTGTGKLLRK